MKKFIGKVALLAACLCLSVCGIHAQVTPTSQMEKIDRGVFALKNGNGSGNFISWRLLGTDDQNVRFNVLRDGTRIAENIGNVTYYIDDVEGVHQYQVETVLNGEVIETSNPISSIDDYFYKFTLTYHNGGSSYYYSPNDITVADLDGDGEYELIVKWDPSNSKDNSESGKTARVLVEAYKLSTGKCMWKIIMGYAIRAGAHYTQILAYDFDGDGKAEVIMKTGPNTQDSKKNYVSQVGDDEIKNNAVDDDDTAQNTYRNSSGHIVGGPEYLTVFNGETGEAINTIYYNPNRGLGVGGSASYSSSWGDTSYNRGERYLACVAYLDGPDKNPSAVFCRGYYTRAYLWAVDFDGEKLTTKWLHASTSKTSVTVTDADGNSTTKSYSSNTGNTGYSYTAYGNGNHNLSVADVDGDGCDEIIYGSCAINNDGNLLYAVGFGHGDAMHMGDLCPDRDGLEVFQVHEEKHPSYGYDVHDAATGEVIYSGLISKME